MPRLAALAALLAVLPLAGCRATVDGSGAIVREDREVADFQAVHLAGAGDLVIEEGAAPGLTVEADDNILSLLTSEVDDGVLKLGLRSGVSVRPSKPVRYLLTVTRLSAVKLSGSGTVTAPSLTADDFTLTLSGSADATLGHLDAKSLTVSVSGSGTVTAAGTADTFTTKVSGSGDIRAKELRAKAVSVTVSGSGNAAVWATDSLDVSVSGSGDVAYRGDPSVTRKISGSGSVQQAE